MKPCFEKHQRFFPTEEFSDLLESVKKLGDVKAVEGALAEAKAEFAEVTDAVHKKMPPKVRIDGLLPSEMSFEELKRASKMTPEGKPKNVRFADQAEAAAKELDRREKAGLIPKEEEIPRDKRLDDSDFREELERMAKETGWSKIGGRLIRQKYGERAGEEIISRTKWVPNASWWPNRPDALNSEQVKDAIKRALAGEPLAGKKARMVRYLLDVAQSDIKGETAPLDAIHPDDAAVVDSLSQDDQKAVIEAVDDALGSKPDNWSSMTEAQKDEEPDRIFGKTPGPKAAPEWRGEGVTEARLEPQEREPGQDDEELLTSPTKADLAAKAAQAATGNVEERASAVRDRDTGILSAPEGTAPAREITDGQRTPTQQPDLLAEKKPSRREREKAEAEEREKKRDAEREEMNRVTEEQKKELGLNDGGKPLFSRAPTFYSELSRQIDAAKIGSAPAQGWKDYIRGLKGVKQDEIQWSGLPEWLDLQEGKVTSEQVQQYLAQNGVRVTETELGEREQWRQRMDLLETRGMSNLDYNEQMELGNLRQRFEETGRDPVSEERQTKFSQYTLPGAKEGSYRELLLTLPQEVHKETHAAERLRAELDELRAERESGGPRTNTEINNRIRAINEELAAGEGKKQTFQSGHFDEPNILAHVRFNERTDVEGKRVLFVEEIQSDWAQKGKKEGFAKPPVKPTPLAVAEDIEFVSIDPSAAGQFAKNEKGKFWFKNRVTGEVFPEWGFDQEDATRSALAFLNSPLRQALANPPRPESKIPAAPFVGKTEAWVALTLKRMIRYAAENGMERIAWTTGEQQVSRYTGALRHAVDAIEWKKTPEGVQLIGYKGKGGKPNIPEPVWRAARDALMRNDNLGFDSTGEALGAVLAHSDWATRWDVAGQDDVNAVEHYRQQYERGSQNRNKVVDTTEKEDALSDAIGKSMADKIKNDPAQSGTIEGENIKVDDTGMAAFYDRIVPNVANDVLRKLGGGRVGEVRITVPETKVAFADRGKDRSDTIYPKQPGFAVTPEMREKALGGLPLFKREAEAQKSGQSLESIQAAIAPFLKTWKNSPDVKVIRSMAEAPAAVRVEDQGQRLKGAEGSPRAFFHKGKVYLVAEGLKTPEAAHEALFHEVLGHAGLRGVFGERLNPILDRVAFDFRDRVGAKAAEYGLDMKTPEGRRTAAEEVLAQLAQERPKLNLVHRAIAAVRQFLREHGIDLKLSDNDLIANYILPARGFIERGRTTGGLTSAKVGPATQEKSVPKFSRAAEPTADELPERIKKTDFIGQEGLLSKAAQQIKNQENFKAVAAGTSEAYDGLLRATAPQFRSEAAREVSRQIIEGLGSKELEGIRFRKALDDAIKESAVSTTLSGRARDLLERGLTVSADKIFLRMPEEERYNFMQAMDSGDKAYFNAHPDLLPMAEVINRMFSEKARAVQNLDTGALQNLRENYFPHIVDRPVAGDAMRQIMTTLSKRPLEGSKGFTKQRVFDDVKALRDAGYKMVSSNPLDLVSLKMAEMDKYILAHTMLRTMAADGSGGVQLIRAGEKMPQGYADINGRYGFIGRAGEKYRYVGRDDVAQVLNNYLSPSLYHNKYVGAPFRAYMGAANSLNQFQLGVFSAFHAGFTSMESVISHASIGIKAFSHGDFTGAAKYLAQAPAAWLRNPALGGKILEEMLNKGSHPEMAKIVDGLQLAGFKWQMDHRFQTDSTKKLFSDVGEGRYGRAALRSIPSIVEQSARPIMEWLVPRQKFGVFGEMYNKWIEDHPQATHKELRNQAQQIWNRVDSRLGQVAYDRLFLHNVTKNIGQMLIRAPGWTGGTILEVGGGIKDLAKYALNPSVGLTDRAAYTLSMIAVTGIANAILTSLFTGEAPDDWKDLVAFRTGNLDEYGRPERFMLPTYMKDLYAYAQQPGTTLLHKSHPLLSLVGDVVRNRDYYGTEIRSEDENLFTQLAKTAGYAAKAFVPFWVRGVQKEQEREGSDLATAAPFVGVMPAPSYMNKTAAEKLTAQYGAERAPEGSRTQEETDKSALVRQISVAYRKGEVERARDLYRQGNEDHILTPHDYATAISRAHQDPLVYAFKKLTFDQAKNVFDAANDEEQEKLKPIFARKQAIEMHRKALLQLEPEMQE